MGLCFFLFPYYSAPTLLLLGKLLVAAAFLPLAPGLLRFKRDKAFLALAGFSLAFLLICYLSVSFSPAPWRTFKHVSEEVLLNLLLMFAALLWAANAPVRDLFRLKKVALWSYLWIIFFFFAVYFWWLIKGPFQARPLTPPHFDPWLLLFKLPDWHEYLLDCQNISTYFLFPASMSLAFLFETRERRAFLKSLFLFLSFVFMIFLTTKRSVLLGLFVGGVLGAFLARRFRLLLFWGLFVLGLLVLIVATPIKKFFIREDLRLLFYGGRESWKSERAGSIPWRLYGLPFYLEHLKKHPFKGVGYGRFNLKLNPETRALAKEAHLVHAHNVFLNMALHLGLPGAVVFVLLVLTQGLILWRGFWHRAGPERVFILGFIIYFVAFWVRYQFDDSFRYATSAFYYLYLGLGMGLSLRERP